MGVLDALKELGAEVEFFSIKTMEYMIPAYYIIASAKQVPTWNVSME